MRIPSFKQAAALAIAVAAISPAAVLAQPLENSAAEYAVPADDDDDDFPWGLLGLLGLAGLLGRKHKERDIHVDARRP